MIAEVRVETEQEPAEAQEPPEPPEPHEPPQPSEPAEPEAPDEGDIEVEDVPEPKRRAKPKAKAKPKAAPKAPAAPKPRARKPKATIAEPITRASSPLVPMGRFDAFSSLELAAELLHRRQTSAREQKRLVYKSWLE